MSPSTHKDRVLTCASVFLVGIVGAGPYDGAKALLSARGLLAVSACATIVDYMSFQRSAGCLRGSASDGAYLGCEVERDSVGRKSSVSVSPILFHVQFLTGFNGGNSVHGPHMMTLFLVRVCWRISYSARSASARSGLASG
jgi:hypothetical protein